MSTRRSARVRGRESDAADSTALSDGTDSVARPQAKRVRQSVAQNAETEAVTSQKSGDSPEWMHRTMTPAKRVEWDAVMKTHYHLEKPADLYDLFELALHLSPKEPRDAFVATTGIRLTGPFDVLARSGDVVKTDKPIHLHGRFFLDPPEVVTVAEDVTSDTGAHWGVHRDRVNQTPAYVVFASDASVCSFEPVALSIFSVLHDRLKEKKGKNEAEQLRLIDAYLLNRTTKTPNAVRSQRAGEAIAPSLHGLGIVVPVDAKRDSGNRELPVAGQALRDLLAQVVSGDATARKKLTNLITRATIANDECDFGTGLLLGLDLFTTGSALQKESCQLLRVAYMLLGRKEFAKVASDHVKHRKDLLSPLQSLLDAHVSADSAATPVQLP